MDTIYAVSSGALPAAIAVLRVSGPRAFDMVRDFAGDLPAPRRAVVRALADPADGGLLDRAILLCFPGPRSATGEDLAEFHLHGGRAVVRAVEAALARRPGLRPAEPGEFTRRALLHGRIDLSEAEGLGDLLMAETEAQRRSAIRSAEGAVRRAVEGWTDRLLMLAARVEAELDHSDEEDAADATLLPAIRSGAAALAADIAAVADRPPVERLRDGIRVVLAGPPNAGKSSLLNAMAGRDAAIVSPISGTTRDRIEAPVVRGGIAWLLIDTAGLAARPGDEIEAIGIARAQAAQAEADILLWLGDDAPPAHDRSLWLNPRADLPGRPVATDRLSQSSLTGEGMDGLWDAMAALAADMLPPPDQMALNARQRALAQNAATALRAAAAEGDLLLIAEQLRSAMRGFDAITGRAGVEAMLDALFARFCIGK
ncbi:tRNA uridine-5-carboxymethylaminomethyl(34) synthesis GTPase MnmE [Sphingomonas sp. CBMAI 2297]|uniref:tRNA uridine-5-carboxymethylaminomethyl(34) synthesis GTPase MnmE n=1 Tax=Sphingomonas sp. CBMAI 2297 TaxID=2991720 RepID=UPI00245413F6|nr:tRNA uridine-5-carboxymethylaminomethyl(34) synthesis GTPase MnmE [Sphingomonas sp. CBMAI 2297]MDH4742442.1 tRNA uridine-5-carboxymethylaminomethyl(34) synthesis GTPase MnmE [Sphingomonas sp. CBMAI 2297]